MIPVDQLPPNVIYSPFVQLGALAIFALLMFLFLQRVVGRMMSQSAAREIADRQARGEYDLRMLDQLERIGTLMNNHLTTLHGEAATILENQRAMFAALIEHDRRTK